MTQENTRLPVMEDFYTIQGEGANSGKPAYFIRLGGCDVGCHWCDVKESWDAGKHPTYTIDELLRKVKEFNCSNVVITGGEPCMYDLSALTALLKENDCNIWLETSGAYPIKGTFDWICVSPKKFKAPLEEALKAAHELKVVVFNPSDFSWAEKNAKEVAPDCQLFLQPEWEKEAKMLPWLIQYVKDHPQWRLSLQTHKYMKIP
jgi:7-carboxy-7-deazaguanine synthase